jgi:hypothetical protein
MLSFDGWLLLLALGLVLLNWLLWAPRSLAWTLGGLVLLTGVGLWLIARSGEDDYRRRC